MAKPHRSKQGKPGLVSGCTLRTCPRCEAQVLVPISVDWRICSVCRRKERA